MDKGDLSLVNFCAVSFKQRGGKTTVSKCHRFPLHPPSGKSFAIFLHLQSQLPDWSWFPCSFIFSAKEARGTALLKSLRQGLEGDIKFLYFTQKTWIQ